MEADFSGYATKAGLKCSDGRTIMPDAFKHFDGQTVPLVWQHAHGDDKNVLGHAVLEARPDGLYARGYFNETASGQNVKALVAHGDIKALSIYANKLVERGKQVFHGMIREVSLVLAGANPGAMIDFVNIVHGDGTEDVLEDEAIIFTGLEFEHSAASEADAEDEDLEHSAQTIKDIYDSMSTEQKRVCAYMVGAALEGDAAAHADIDEDALAHTKETDMGKRNVFDQNNPAGGEDDSHTLSHADVKGIVADAVKCGSLKEATEKYALAHGIENLELLFPEAQALSNTPEWDKRRTEWVTKVLGGVHKTPFSRIKSLTADLNFDDARAKGYITGNLKKEQFFSLAKRETTPQTIYKKQKLDRDDIIDITTMDVVAFMKGELRVMLEEELAGAALVGDGREVDDEDKIREDKIRPIATDDDLYTTKVYVNLDDASSSYNELVDALILARIDWRGTGSPTWYTDETTLTRILLIRDADGHRLYKTQAELEAELRLSSIVVVDVIDRLENCLGVIVNLADYTIGADRGGQVNMFDDFDIDYNQYKYLIETRCSGALTKFKSALAIFKVAGSDTLVVPTIPVFDEETNTITIPTITGVQYKIDGVNQTNGAAVVITTNTKVTAHAKTGYFAAQSPIAYRFTVQDI